MKTILPDAIQDEIFCLSSQVSDVVIDYVSEHIEQFGFTILSITNNDCSINIDFACEDTVGNLRVDRIHRCFEVVAKQGDYTILPRISDWEGVLEYLEKVGSFHGGSD